MHFNATVTGYFTLPHKLFTSTLPLGIYLGDFGSSLFFIVSGASLALTVPAEQCPAQFYKRRARAVYPLFWLAWFVVFSYRFVAHPGSFGGARTVTLVLTLLGLDNFAVAAGWVGTDFACVGEWFLGSILFLYLLFPLLQRGLRKRPWLTWGLTLAVCIPVHLLGWDARLVAVHIPEFLFGMTFLTLAGRTRCILAPLLLAGALAWLFAESVLQARPIPALTKALRTALPLAVLAGVCYNFCVYFAAEPQLMGQNPALYENVSRLVQFWL